MPETEIRPAIASDLPDLVGIYNHYVTNSHVTFDTEPFTADERRSWFGGFSASGPFRLLVAQLESQIVGYASSARFRPKPAYYRSVETTVYIEPSHVGAGLGRMLYGALLNLLTADPGVHRAYGGIVPPNPASIALHETMGFQLAGTFREVGHKFDRYWDVCWYEKSL